MLPKPFRDASFAFNGTVLQGTPQQRPRDKLGAQRDQQRAAGRGRQGLCRQIFPGLGQGRDPGHGRQSSRPPSPRRVQAIDWMAPSTKQEALKKVRGHRRRRRLSRHTGAIIRACTITRRQRLRQPEERGAVRVPAPDREDRQADGPQRMVDAAAAGQRGQPAGAERAELPGRDPGQAILRSKRRRRVQLRRDRQRSIGHEISHSFDNGGALFDASGALRNWWTPADFNELPGGRRRACRRSSTPMRRCRACTSTAS